jgi:hypothetical protein
MSVWRRRAIESFPELRQELNDRDEIPNPYRLWMELLWLWSNAHHCGDDEILDRIYDYADWCFQQRAKDLWNSVAVCFYEHVLDEGSWEAVLPRLSDENDQGRVGAVGVLPERSRRGGAPEAPA